MTDEAIFLEAAKLIQGEQEGERCNRVGSFKVYLGHGDFDEELSICHGTIELKNVDTSCSCHLGHPPCPHCVTPREHCPDCGWDAETELAREYHRRNKLEAQLIERRARERNRKIDNTRPSTFGSW